MSQINHSVACRLFDSRRVILGDTIARVLGFFFGCIIGVGDKVGIVYMLGGRDCLLCCGYTIDLVALIVIERFIMTFSKGYHLVIHSKSLIILLLSLKTIFSVAETINLCS